MTVQMLFGMLVAATCNMHRWSENELARRARVSLAEIVRVKAGEQSASPDTYRSIGVAMGMNLVDLALWESLLAGTSTRISESALARMVVGELTLRFSKDIPNL
jgi:hypothetical protein